MRTSSFATFVSLAAAWGCAKPADSARPIRGAGEYDVVVGPGARELAVEATLPAGYPERVAVEAPATPFVRAVELSLADGAWAAAERRGDDFALPGCAANGCRVRYRFQLDEAAAALRDDDVAAKHGPGAYQAPLSSWLLHGSGTTPDAYRVQLAPGAPVLSGVPKGASGALEIVRSSLDDAPFTTIGAWRSRSIREGQATLDVAVLPAARAMDDDAVERWVRDAARGIASYYGGFPAPHVLVVVTSTAARERPPPGDRSFDGKTLGGAGGASVLMRVGDAATADDARATWVLTHELIHVGFPTLGGTHGWLEEGIATYLEPIVRVRAGVQTAEALWRDVLRESPKGLPERGDQGLERTPTWGRKYWGGALFYLLADIEIRSRTGNARSLRDALRAIAARGGNVASRWDVPQLIAVADAATGVPAFRELYEKMAFTPVAIDLPALWARLGIRLDGDTVVYDEAAPLAEVRRGLTAAK